MTQEKQTSSVWSKMALAAAIGGGVVQGGTMLAHESPIHFSVVGEAPVQAEGWVCAPEGGIIGAPLVCHPSAELIKQFSTDTSTETE